MGQLQRHYQIVHRRLIISFFLKVCFFCQFYPAMNSGSLAATLLVRSRNQHRPCRRRIVSRSSVTVSPRRRCKTAARIQLPPSCSKRSLQSRNIESAESHCTKSLQSGGTNGIRPGRLGHLRIALAQPARKQQLESNANCDRNNLGVNSGGGRVVITCFHI